MKKNLYLMASALVLALQSFSQNNLINNSSFENGGDIDTPCKSGLVNSLSEWESDCYYPGGSGCTYQDCSTGYQYCTGCSNFDGFHSSDWWKNENNLAHVRETNDSPDPANPGYYLYYNVSGRTGVGYAGFSENELIEQKLHVSNPLLAGETYIFSMYVRIPRPNKSNPVSKPSFPLITYPKFNANSSSILDPLSNINISVYLATQKIKYSDGPVLTCNSSGATELKDGPNNIMTLTQFNIRLADYPAYSWHKLSYEFVCPSSPNYDWIAIEMDGAQTDYPESYILVDDVSLIRKCELGCRKTSGTPNPVISIPDLGSNQCAGAMISNISNVEQIKIEVFTMLGQLIKTLNFFNTNGFDDPIFWDGTTSTPSDAAAATYVIKVTSTNQCGTFIHSAEIPYFGCGSTGPPANPPASTVTDIKYNDCCELDFYFNSKTFNTFLPTQHPYSYKPKNNIYINNCNFTTISNSTFKAGKEIKVTGETAIASGSSPYAGINPEFHALIEECPDAHRTAQDNNSGPSENTTADNLSIQSHQETGTVLGERSLSVYPNPARDDLFIKTDLENYSVLIMDISGRVVLDQKLSGSTKLNIQHLNNGVYIYKVNNNDKALVKTGKLIINH